MKSSYIIYSIVGISLFEVVFASTCENPKIKDLIEYKNKVFSAQCHLSENSELEIPEIKFGGFTTPFGLSFNSSSITASGTSATLTSINLDKSYSI